MTNCIWQTEPYKPTKNQCDAADELCTVDRCPLVFRKDHLQITFWKDRFFSTHTTETTSEHFQVTEMRKVMFRSQGIKPQKKNKQINIINIYTNKPYISVNLETIKYLKFVNYV